MAAKRLRGRLVLHSTSSLLVQSTHTLWPIIAGTPGVGHANRCATEIRLDSEVNVTCRCTAILMIVAVFELSASPAKVHGQVGDLKAAAPMVSIDFEEGPFPRGLRFASDGSKLWTDKLSAWSLSTGEKLSSSPFKSQKNSRFIFDLAGMQPLMLIVDPRLGKLLFWDQSGKPHERTLSQKGDVSAGRYIDNGRRFALIYADPAAIYFGDVDSVENDAILPLPFKVHKSVISPGGNLVAGGSGGDIQLWDVREKKIRSELHHSNKVFALAFSNDERLIATGTSQDNVVRLFDTKNGKLIAEMAGHGRGTIFLASAVYSLAFSPNGKWLASGGHDGSVIVWDIETHKPVFRAQVAGPPIVCSVAFSSDSKLVAGSFENASAKRGIRVWKIP